MTQEQYTEARVLDRLLNIYDHAFKKISEDAIGTFAPEVKDLLTETLQIKINELQKQFEQL